MSGKEYVAACSESMKLASSPKPVHKVNINVDIDVDHIVVPFLSVFRNLARTMVGLLILGTALVFKA